MSFKKIVEIDGKTIIFETGKIAKQANGSVLIHSGDTTLLATACASKEISDEIDFLPLRVDYQEKFSSVGKTIGGFLKREGRPSTREILVSRFIDRSMRPLFDDLFFSDVQILSYVYSYDGINTPDILSISAASAALLISDIPFYKPFAAVRVGMINDTFVINPNPEEQKSSSLDLVLSGTKDAILMIEGFSDFLTEDQILEAIDYGHMAIKKICLALEEWQKEVGKEKTDEQIYKMPENLEGEIAAIAKKPLEELLKVAEKKKREKLFSSLKDELIESLSLKGFLKRDITVLFKKFYSSLMRKMILEENKRVDGRAFDEIRKIEIETGFLPRTHGNALFTRGETQAIAVCTLGSKNMGQRYEDLHGEGAERFYLQYFFPPFSVGEVGRSGPPGRREIGHGKLAQRALSAILPDEDSFPYVIRLESNITESNGSSSMASVCGGCLALMNAGVPVKKAVSGIAMGLILDGERFQILSDIIGLEDFLGDMDFKITGDENGITAFQMDIKVEGITKDIMRKALSQAKDGRIEILKKMLEKAPEKPTLSIYAPRIKTMQIKQSQIGTVIGPGGKQIRAIVDETGVELDVSNDGLITISSATNEGIEKAEKILIDLTGEVEKGKVYEGTITSIKDFGLFVKIYAAEGLCHISEISNTHIKDPREIFKAGDLLKVKVMDINDRGQIRLSHKALLED